MVAGGGEDVVVASTAHPHLIFLTACVDVSLESEVFQNEWGMVLIQELHKVKYPSSGLETRTGLNEEKKNITILDCFGFGLWTELNPNPNQTKLGLV